MVFFPLLVQYDMVCPDRTNQTNGDEDYIYSGLPGWKRRFGFLSGFRPTNTALHYKTLKGNPKTSNKSDAQKAHLNTLLETNSTSSENSPSFKGMSSSNCYFLRGKRAQFWGHGFLPRRRFETTGGSKYPFHVWFKVVDVRKSGFFFSNSEVYTLGIP